MNRRAQYGNVLLAAAILACTATTGRAVILSPNDLPGLGLWLDAGQGVTLNGSNVASWQDQSADLTLFGQAIATKQPEFVASVAGFNGKPAIRFSPGATPATDGDFLANSAAPGVLKTANTVFAVFQANGYAGQIIYDSGTDTATSPNGARHYMHVNSAYGVRGGTINNARVDNNNGLNPASFVIYSQRQNGLDSTSLINGGHEVKWNASPTGIVDSPANFTVGARFSQATAHFNGDVTEIVAYDRALGASEMRDVEAYLSAKYGIPLAPDPTLPALLLQPPTLMLDIGGKLPTAGEGGDTQTNAGNSEAGWTQLGLAAGGDVVANGSLIGGVKVTLSLQGGSAGTAMLERDRVTPAASASMTLEQVYDDFIFVSQPAVVNVGGVQSNHRLAGDLAVTLENLKPNTNYVATIYSGDNSSSPESIFDVYANGVKVYNDHVAGSGTNSAGLLQDGVHTFSFATISDAAGQLALLLDNDSVVTTTTTANGTFSNQINGALLNGLVLQEAVPEPSSWALFGLGVVGWMLAYRRRTRHI